MKKKILSIVIFILALLGYGLFRGIQTLRKKRTPQARLLQTLSRLTAARKNAGYLGKQALVLSLPSESQLILIGGLQGNSKSLERILSELQRTKLLSGQLLEQNTFLVFNGNCLGSTRYNGEVLTAIGKLMHANPQRVWFLRGPQEEADTAILTHLFGKAVTDVQRKGVQAFLSTLPLGIYLFATDLDEKPIRISPYDKEAGVFQRIACKQVKDKEPVKAICSLRSLCSYHEGDVSGEINSDDQEIDWTTMKGFQRSESGWHLISSPPKEYELRYGYDITSYAVIKVGPTLAQSSLTFYRTEGDAFVVGGSFNIS